MNSIQNPARIKKWIAVYLGAVSCIFVPLYIKGSYFGLIELKSRAYLYTAVPAVILSGALTAAELLFDRERPGTSAKKEKRERNKPSWKEMRREACFKEGTEH